MKKIEDIIKNTNEQNQDKVNWMKAWSKKYPILASYQNEVDVKMYQEKINDLLSSLEKDYKYNKLDAMLVLKDILYQVYKNIK